MGIPSRHEPVDDRPDDDVPTPTPTQRADPLTAPLAELIADPLTGPLIHPKLAIPAPAAEGADEDAHSAEHDAYVDPVADSEPDEGDPVAEPGEGDPVVEPDAAIDQPAQADEYVDPVAEADPADQQPAPEPTRNDVTVVDVDTEGFEPSAPLDVFAALREPPPAEPAPKKRRALRSTRSSRKRKPAPGQTTPHDDLPTAAEPEPEPEPEPQTRAEPAVASDPPPLTAEVETQTIADAAVIGPALAAVLEAHDGTPDVPATGHGSAAPPVAKEPPPMTPESDHEALPEHDAVDHATDATATDATAAEDHGTDATDADAHAHAATDAATIDAEGTDATAASPSDASVDTTDEPTDDEPAYETLEELLNAVTARTHPPTALRPVEDPPATLAWQPTGEPAPETPAESITPADDPRRATAAGVARLLAPATAPDETEPVAAPQAASTPPTAAPETPHAPARTSPVRNDQPRPASEPQTTAAKQPPTPSRRADTVDVSARRSTQHLLLVLLLIGLVTTVALAWMAWQEKSPTSIAVAVAAAVVTFIIWNAHSTAAPPQVVVERGMLDIRTHDSHHRFDLASNHTRFDVIGTPGKRGWKVLIHRIGMAPYKLDASMVDPRALTEAMAPYRS